MTAKEYLQQIQQFNLRIEQMKMQLKESRELIKSVPTVRTDNVKVQKSGNVDKIGDMVAKIVDLENEIDDELVRLFEMKHYIIGQLHRLENSNHIELLFKRYVEFKRFEIIADEMELSCDYIRRLHGYALKAFEKMYKNELQKGQDINGKEI